MSIKLGEEAAQKGDKLTIAVSLSGRGDKDMETAMEYFNLGKATQEDVK